MDVGAWLRGLGWSSTSRRSATTTIDADVLPELTADDLSELGVASLGHRRKLLDAIAALRAARRTPPAPAARRRRRAPACRASRAQAERRQLTVMFVDLVGSTALSARLDPEDMREVIRAYQNAVAGEVARFEGHVAKFMGDGVLAYFGWPRAHEDEAERAVRAGLAHRRGRRPARDAGRRAARRAGRDRDRARRGRRPASARARRRRRRSSARPRTSPPGCRRWPSRAPWSSPRARAGSWASCSSCATSAPPRLKGFAEPVRGLRASLGEGAAESRFEALHAAGRSRRWSAASRSWRCCSTAGSGPRSGEGQVVLLVGRGRASASRAWSRALRERLGGEPHTPLRHFCSPYHTDTALHPVIAPARAGGRARAATTRPSAKLDKLEALLARDGRGRRARPCRCSPTCSAIPAGDRYPPLDAHARSSRRSGRFAGAARPARRPRRARAGAGASTRTCTGPTRPRSSCWTWWSSGSQRLPVLVLVTFRPEFAPPWAGHAARHRALAEPPRPAAGRRRWSSG